jgi:hypothetical protein
MAQKSPAALTGSQTGLLRAIDTFNARKCILSRHVRYYVVGIKFTSEREGRKGPPAGNKTTSNRKRTAQSKAAQRKAKPNQKNQSPQKGRKTGLIYNIMQ